MTVLITNSFDVNEDDREVWKYVGLTLTAVSAVYFCLVVALSKRIRIAVRVIKVKKCSIAYSYCLFRAVDS